LTGGQWWLREQQRGRGHLPLDTSGRGGYSGAAGSSLLELAAAGATSGPAAPPYAPATTAMATRPSSPPPRLVDNPHAPPCPPMPPLPRARQLEPAPWRLVGGMAGDVCRPHQEDRPAQGQLTARALAFAITGGAVHPPAAPRYVLCGLPGQKPDVWCWSAVVFAVASERGAESLKPAMCAACPTGRLQRHSSLRRSAADPTSTTGPPTT
jgi:hypothetical protein